MVISLRAGWWFAGSSPIFAVVGRFVVVCLTQVRRWFLSCAELLLVLRPPLLHTRLCSGFHTSMRLQGEDSYSPYMTELTITSIKKQLHGYTFNTTPSVTGKSGTI